MEKEIKKSNCKKSAGEAKVSSKGCNTKFASKQPNIGEIGVKNQGAKMVAKVIEDYKNRGESQKECKDYSQIDNI